MFRWEVGMSTIAWELRRTVVLHIPIEACTRYPASSVHIDIIDRRSGSSLGSDRAMIIDFLHKYFHDGFISRQEQP